MKNRIMCLLLLLSLLVLPVSAAQEGSLLINNADSPATLYVVADQDGKLTEAFTGCGLAAITEETATAENAKLLRTYVQSSHLAGQVLEPTAERQIIFAPLKESWYLVCSNSSPGEFAPFLVQVPTMVGDNQIYHIQATPKEDSQPEQTLPATPVEPEPNIPQTGYLQWPKYLLLTMGGLLVLAGAVLILAGLEERHG